MVCKADRPIFFFFTEDTIGSFQASVENESWRSSHEASPQGACSKRIFLCSKNIYSVPGPPPSSPARPGFLLRASLPPFQNILSLPLPRLFLLVFSSSLFHCYGLGGILFGFSFSREGIRNSHRILMGFWWHSGEC